MRIVITGATGAIGMSLLSKLTQENYDITVIANKNSKRNKRLKKFENITIIEASLDEYLSIELEGKYDAFIHMAWNGGKDRDNKEANFNSAIASSYAVELAAKYNCEVFLSTGSQAEYGIKSEKISEETKCDPDTSFGVAKLSSMWLTKNECTKNNLRRIWLRIFSVYGNYDGEQTMIMQTIRKVKKGENPIFTSGNQLWDFLHSDDVADAIIRLLTNKNCSGLYIVGNGEKKQLKDYLKIISNQLDFSPNEAIGAIKTKDTEQRNLWLDCSKLKLETDWVPKVDFLSGFKTVVEYCEKNSNGS